MELKFFSLSMLNLLHLINRIDCSAKKIPQIKAVGTQVVNLNPLYSDEVILTIHRLNDTFNYVGTYWELKRDPPADLAVYVKVFVTDSTYQNETLILETVTPICKPSKNRELLHNIMQVPECALNTRCIKKGVYKTDKMIQYRFEVLVPNIECLGSYYKAEYRWGNKCMTVGTIRFYNEWGYLRDV